MNIKNYLILLSLILIFSRKAKSQQDTLPSYNNRIYIELFGIGGYGSLNYEHIFFTAKKLKVAVRVGITTYNIRDYTGKFNPDIILPASINSFYGNRHKIEMGIGQTVSNIVTAYEFTTVKQRQTNLHAHFNIGYRYERSRILFRVCYSPIIGFYTYYQHWGGMSIGYIF